jgi:hypothetical protein
MHVSEQVITYRDISMLVYVSENASMLICLTFFSAHAMCLMALSFWTRD